MRHTELLLDFFNRFHHFFFSICEKKTASAEIWKAKNKNYESSCQQEYRNKKKKPKENSETTARSKLMIFLFQEGKFTIVFLCLVLFDCIVGGDILVFQMLSIPCEDSTCSLGPCGDTLRSPSTSDGFRSGVRRHGR